MDVVVHPCSSHQAMTVVLVCSEVFGSLDRAEEILSKQRYIAGSRFTEADLRLFVTLIRFDEVSSLLV